MKTSRLSSAIARYGSAWPRQLQHGLAQHASVAAWLADRNFTHIDEMALIEESEIT
eukprot:SAG11_NODE_29953_length_305_cov_1.242718_1_plen_55_part_01